MNVQLRNIQINFEKSPRIVAVGYTGCGKTQLLKELFQNLSESKDNEFSFLLIDQKQTEWKDVEDNRQFLPVLHSNDEIEKAINLVLSKNWEKPLFIFWDTFSNFVQENKGYELFKKLLETRQNNVYIIACESRPDALTDLWSKFDIQLFGDWNVEYINQVDSIPGDIKSEICNKLVDLKTGEFIESSENKLSVVKSG